MIWSIFWLPAALYLSSRACPLFLNPRGDAARNAGLYALEDRQLRIAGLTSMLAGAAPSPLLKCAVETGATGRNSAVMGRNLIVIGTVGATKARSVRSSICSPSAPAAVVALPGRSQRRPYAGHRRQEAPSSR